MGAAQHEQNLFSYTRRAMIAPMFYLCSQELFVAMDPFESTVDSPIAPAQNCFAVTPHDTAPLPLVTKSIYVGEGGDLALRPLLGEAVVIFRNLQAGMTLDVRARTILATGTTASAIVGLA